MNHKEASKEKFIEIIEGQDKLIQEFKSMKVEMQMRECMGVRGGSVVYSKGWGKKFYKKIEDVHKNYQDVKNILIVFLFEKF